MTKQSTKPATTPVAQAAAQAAFDPAATIAQAAALATADASFETALAGVAEAVARILGTAPTYDHWEHVQAAFCAEYVRVRACKEETARKRWSAVAGAMESAYALEKPIKPTEAAAKKAEERKGAAEAAQALIAAAGATTPQAIIALTADPAKPLPRAVTAELSKRAGEAANEAQKQANEAAKQRMSELRESIRKTCNSLTLAHLELVATYVASLAPAKTVAPVVHITPAAAAVGLPTLEVVTA